MLRDNTRSITGPWMNFVFSLSSQISCIYSTNTLNILSEQFQNSSSHEYNFILRKHSKNMLNVKGEHEY
jgi:hypothetical protein